MRILRHFMNDNNTEFCISDLPTKDPQRFAKVTIYKGMAWEFVSYDKSSGYDWEFYYAPLTGYSISRCAQSDIEDLDKFLRPSKELKTNCSCSGWQLLHIGCKCK